MNIFVLSEKTYEAAAQHCDKHVVKMVLEYAQLLSTAHRVLDGTDNVLPDPRKEELLYRATHVNHPCSKWVRESAENYAWTWELLRSLCDEYYFRYGQHKTTDQKHKVERSGLLNELSHAPVNLDAIGRTPFVQCMPDQYKDDDTIQAYRNYYLGEKKHILKFKSRGAPEWIT